MEKREEDQADQADLEREIRRRRGVGGRRKTSKEHSISKRKRAKEREGDRGRDHRGKGARRTSETRQLHRPRRYSLTATSCTFGLGPVYGCASVSLGSTDIVMIDFAATHAPRVLRIPSCQFTRFYEIERTRRSTKSNRIESQGFLLQRCHGDAPANSARRNKQRTLTAHTPEASSRPRRGVRFIGVNRRGAHASRAINRR